ncbi:hypothetical protein ABZT51_38605 [Streptomyces sp. NPDC005373]|uniref:hypothetical protein n=1 Tax=Streptomyces sp. NPDC005373 TaxID=3156879 RepID=UPI0033AF5DD2
MKKEPQRSGTSDSKGQADRPDRKGKKPRSAPHKPPEQALPHPLEHTADTPASDAGAPQTPQQQIVITIGEGHPRFQQGTFDAAALLTSVLAAVQPAITAGMHSLHNTLDAADDRPEAIANAVRAAGQQIADAVRSGVVEGMGSRDRHLAQLAVIDRAAAQASGLKPLQRRIDRELALAGLQRISDLSDLSPFNLAGGSSPPDHLTQDSDAYELVSPAYVDAETGRTIERGWIRSPTGEQSAAPAGKLHGSASHKHKDRHREKEPTPTETAAPAPGQAQTAAPQQDPAKRLDEPLPSAASAGTQAPLTPTGVPQAQDQTPEETAAPAKKTPKDAHGPEAPHEATSPEPPDSLSQTSCLPDADTSPAGAQLPAATRHQQEPPEATRQPRPRTASPGNRMTPRRTARRAPGSIGGVTMPRRLTQQPQDKPPDTHNEAPGETS